MLLAGKYAGFVRVGVKLCSESSGTAEEKQRMKDGGATAEPDEGQAGEEGRQQNAFTVSRRRSKTFSSGLILYARITCRLLLCYTG